MMRIFVACLCLIGSSAAALAADDPAKVETRTTVPYEKPAVCDNPPSSLTALGASYYTESSTTFVGRVGAVLQRCIPSVPADRYVMVLLAIRSADEKDAVIHVLLEWKDGAPVERASLPGVSTATWVFLTDHEEYLPITQLMSTTIENPLSAKAGPLAAALLGAFPGVTRMQMLTPPIRIEAAPPAAIYSFVAHRVALPFRRASIAEKDVVQGPVDKDGKPAPIDSSDDFANVPATWLTVHAGAGVLAGALHGASPAKIDHDEYVSDLPRRAATFVGVAFHAPFDSTRPVPSGAERFGVVLSGVLTPAAGVYLGASFGWRSLSLTAGPVWMWVQSPPPDFQIGDATRAVKDGGPSPQLVLGRVRAWLIGATYALK